MMTTQPAAVHALLTFLATHDGGAVYVPSVGGADTVDRAQGSHTQVSVPVHNARRLDPPPTLEKQGFQLVSQTIVGNHDDNGVAAAAAAAAVTDFYDDYQVQSVYHDAVQEWLLAHIPGATRVEIFDDTRRSSSDETRSQRKVREPSANVHNDYTPRSAQWRLQGYLQAKYPDESSSSALEQWLAKYKRWCIINVWRSIRGPVLNYPMVLCDSTTVEDRDICPVERKSAQRRGEIQMAVYNQNQRWYYYPQMQMNEALLIKTFDSSESMCKTLHSSFADPTAPLDAPARESIETRCFVFF